MTDGIFDDDWCALDGCRGTPPSGSDGIEPDDYVNLPEGASPNWTIMDELGLDDGIEGARPVGTWIDEPFASDGTDNGDVRRVTFLGQPGAGKSELAGSCGERCDGTEPPFEGEIPATARCCGTNICGTGIVGMFSLGGELSRRAKDITRGRPSSDGTEERPVDGSL